MLVWAYDNCHGDTSITPSDGVFCVGETVGLSGGGSPDPPEDPCGCDGTWLGPTSGYGWSGDVTGASGASANLDTSSAGGKSVTFYVTNTWTCSTNATPMTYTTNSFATGAYTVVGVGAINPQSTEICAGSSKGFAVSPVGGSDFPSGQPTWSVSPAAAGSFGPGTGASTTFTAASTFGGTATITVQCGTSSSTATVNVVLVSGVTPNKGCVGFAHAVTISGAGFTQPVTVEVDDPAVSVSNVQFVNDQTVTATFTIGIVQEGGQRDVSVNGCTGTGLFKVQIPRKIGEAAAPAVAGDQTRGLFKYQVQDQDGAAITQAGLPVFESFAGTATAYDITSCDANYNCTMIVYGPGTFGQQAFNPLANTDGSGQFPDPVGSEPGPLRSLRNLLQVDIVYKITDVNHIYEVRLGNPVTPFPLLPVWVQQICQTAIKQGQGNQVVVGNCGASHAPSP